MKNQNDLIVIGVSVLLSIGFALFFFFTKREPVTPAAPTEVITSAPIYPTNTQPSMAASLPGGGGGAPAGGMMGGMGGGMMGGRMGGGPKMGMAGGGGPKMGMSGGGGGGPKMGMAGGGGAGKAGAD
jgi:hypothetical protein